ncbi:MAG TPA: hypothetical protein VK815_09390 [Candidatus Acidoferrales bacterium]|jgi:hypothetical protein|nr:hypothetical protein [Candidatus Acidoferrales bacterium]
MSDKFLLCLALILSGGLSGCSTAGTGLSGWPVHYRNAQYDFTFSLPAGWQGYSVLMQPWDGGDYSRALDKIVVTEHGQAIVLRHPRWQTNDLYQDIPIVVFTHRQWAEEQQGKMWPDIYAGGVIDELWHNRKYVFAISSRYNAADDVKGRQEAAEIIATNCAAHPGPPLYPNR